MSHREIEISSSDDVIDVRDVIARIETLESERDSYEGEDTLATWRVDNEDEARELDTLSTFMDDMKGYGGDAQWRGDWYPITLIRDSHFRDYAYELADDCGMIDNAAKWPYTCIDWERAAHELRQDYTAVEFDGVTYWYR